MTDSEKFYLLIDIIKNKSEELTKPAKLGFITGLAKNNIKLEVIKDILVEFNEKTKS